MISKQTCTLSMATTKLMTERVIEVNTYPFKTLDGRMIGTKPTWENRLKAMTLDQARETYVSCCEKGNLDRVIELESLFTDCFDDRALQSACRRGRLCIIEHLHQVHRDHIDVTLNHNSALEIACQLGYETVVQYLLDNWGDKIEAAVRSDAAFAREARQFDHSCLVLLLTKYPGLFDLLDKPFERWGLFSVVCENGWRDVVGLMIGGYVRVLIEAPSVTTNQSFGEICKRDWDEHVRTIITGITDAKLRQQLVQSAVLRSFANYGYNTGFMLVNDFAGDITKNIVIALCSSCCNSQGLWRLDKRHRLIDRLLACIKLEPESWHSILESTCKTGCPYLLNRFATDLGSKIDSSIYDRVLRVAAYYETCNRDRYKLIEGDPEPVLAFVRQFKDCISTPTLQALFSAACTRTRTPHRRNRSIHYSEQGWTMLVGLLEHTSNRLDLAPMTLVILCICLTHCSLPQIQVLLRVCKGIKPSLWTENKVICRWDGYQRVYDKPVPVLWATKIVQNRWDEWDIVKALVEHDEDIIDVPEIIRFAIRGVHTQYLDRVQSGPCPSIEPQPSPEDRAKYIINHYFTCIDRAGIEQLFSLPSSMLYEMLSAEDVKILIDDHKHEEGFDEIVKMLSPHHPNTVYALTDYGVRRIKAHGS